MRANTEAKESDQQIQRFLGKHDTRVRILSSHVQIQGMFVTSVLRVESEDRQTQGTHCSAQQVPDSVRENKMMKATEEALRHWPHVYMYGHTYVFIVHT